MSERLRIDPGELREAATELLARAEEAARALAELKADLAREGECWGDDEPGKAIAESYVPGAEQNMAALEDLVQNVHALSANLRSAAESFEGADREGGSVVRNTAPETGEYGVATTEQATWNDQPNRSVASPLRTPWGGIGTAPAVERTSGSPSQADTSGGTQQHVPDPFGGSPTGTASPASNSGGITDHAAPGGANSNGDDSGGADGIDQPQTSDRPTTSELNSSASQQSPAPLLSDRHPMSDRGGNARTPAAATPEAPRIRSASDPAVSQRPGTPWSNPSAGTSPEQQAPPRISPPRRREAPKPSATPEQRKEPAPASPPPRVTDEEAMRIITAMAVRHNLRITGFEESRITAQTAQEIADAVDTVLTGYSIALHGIEVADTDDALSGVENRAAVQTSPTAEAPLQPWIILDRRAVVNPGLLSGSDRPREHSAAEAHQPMHARMLREFGRVADLAGGFRARPIAQRALITEYLRATGAEGRTLGDISDGYRRWRGGLGDHCFDGGVLNPGRALAEGFAVVEERGGQAPGPHQVLHRLLLVMARADLR
ncbi:WXG100 family type VII secretion target [Nocardia sp. CA-119907]|uniref:WXG100 family type VII secretion target n=1 Tax=Nocardia sp. CA-119907 TaxID=3239973 RepID=UPI003D975B51